MKIGVLLSGGVDSSYSAYLLKSKGYEVVGFYFKFHDDEKKHIANINNVEKISKNLGIDIHIIEAQELFKKEVYDYFVNTYKLGLTPNPCAMCNPKMKFGFGLQKVEEFGCEKIATGHYARVENGSIKEALDDTKDQSYFLYGLQKEVVKKLVFPLGNSYKSDIKPQAFQAMPWLGELEKYKESQEICFVQDSYIEILQKHFDVDKQGIVLDKNNNTIGTHKGYMHYTIGKRRGFDVPLAHAPNYVLDINPHNNSITVGAYEDLATTTIKASNISLDEDFIDGEYFIKARYKSQKTKAFITKKRDIIEAKLSQAVFGVAKGQSLVVYKDDLVLGGGIII